MMCLEIITLTRRELLKVGIFLGLIPQRKIPPKKRAGPSAVPPFIWG